MCSSDGGRTSSSLSLFILLMRCVGEPRISSPFWLLLRIVVFLPNSMLGGFFLASSRLNLRESAYSSMSFGAIPLS